MESTDIEEHPPVWCMRHGMPEADRAHTDSPDCLYRMMREDEFERISKLLDQLSFTWEWIHTESTMKVLVMKRKDPERSTFRMATLLEQQLIGEIERLRKLLWREEL